MNRLSLHIYLKHKINMNEHHNVFYFNRGKMAIHSFSSLSSLKIFCSPVYDLFVGQDGGFSIIIGQITFQSRSANGQL